MITRIRLWKGYHCSELFDLIRRAWDQEELLILCPPLLQDFSFLLSLPPCPITCHGGWSNFEVESVLNIKRAPISYPIRPALGVFTSGTLSSSPRLVLYTKQNILISINSIYGLFENIKSIFCYPQAFHTFGLTLGYVACHVNNWRLITPNGKYQQSSHIERAILDRDGLITLGTPTHFFDLMTYLKSTSRQIAPSYSCIIGGAKVTRALWLKIKSDLHIDQPSIGYGCTEASPGISHLAPGTEPICDDEIGLPLNSLTSSITKDGVQIDGPSLCSTIIQNGKVEFPRRLTIRDRIEVLSNGRWVFSGRLDLTLNRGGQKFSLEAIEGLLHQELKVSVLASAVRDTRLGEDLALAFSGECDKQNVLNKSQSLLLEKFGIRLNINRTVFLSDFPLNECSKLDRKAVSRAFEVSP